MASKQAIQGKKVSAFQLDPREVTIVGLDTDDGPEHPLYQDRATLTIPPEHVQTAMIHGISDPVFVTKDKEGSLLVVSGRQRTKALRLANEAREKAGLSPKLLTVMLAKDGKRRFPTDKALIGQMVRENALRRDLEPIEKAELAKRMVEEHGFTLEETAVEFGLTKQRIKDYLEILNRDPAVLDAVRNRKLSAHWALTELRKVPVERQAEVVEQALAQREAPKNREGGRASDGSAPPAKPKKNMNKQYARFMAEAENSPLQEKFMVLLQWSFGLATTAETERLVPGFKKALAQAKRALQ